MFAKSLMFALLINAAVGAPFFGILSNAVKTGSNTLNDGFSEFKNPLTSAFTDMSSMFSQGANAAGASLQTISNNTQAAANTALDASAGLLGSGINLKANIIANKLRLLGKGIKTIDQINKAILSGSIKIGSSLANAAGTGIASAGKLGAAGLGLASGGVDTLTTLANNANKLAVDAVGNIGTGVSSGIQGTTDNIASIIDSASSQGNKMFDSVSSLAQTSTKNALTEINKAVESATENAAALTNNGMNQVLSTMTKGSEAAAKMTGDMLTQAEEALDKGLNAANQGINSAIAQAGASMKTAATLAEDATNKGVQTLNDATNKGVQTLNNAVNEAEKATGSLVTQGTEKVNSAINQSGAIAQNTVNQALEAGKATEQSLNNSVSPNTGVSVSASASTS